MQKEIWKDISGYEGKYQVSSAGRIRSLSYKRTGKIRVLSTSISSAGYIGVTLTLSGRCKTRSVHQLVAIAFLNHIPCGQKLVVNHINFNKLDNRVENLEIVTQRENANQKHIKSSSKYVGVSWFERDKKWTAAIKIDGKSKYLGMFSSELDAHLAYQSELKQISYDRGIS